MSDAFDDLREQGTPVDPDPVFARRLRARVERALVLPRGVVPVTATATRPTDTAAPTSPRPAAVPYLAVADARAAIDWYVDVFGAELAADPIVMPDERIGHAELSVGGGVLYLADAHPEIGVTAPRAGEASVSLMLAVDDADRMRARAMARGASGDRPPYDAYGSRNAWIVDPFGHRWGLSSPLPTASSPHAELCRPGDVVYASIWAPSAERSRDFYRAVLDWGYDSDGRVGDARPHVGFFAADGTPTLFCCIAVDDLSAARARVLAAGGSAGEVQEQSFGTVVDCTDDQGTPFALYLIGSGTTEFPPRDEPRPGDLGYLTLQVVDSAKARAFYGAVFGWTFTPGRAEDGWAVEGTRPTTGLSGGHKRASTSPMWFARDLADAVAAVRAAGGTATDPERQPYGLTSTCIDDQGARFYLGEA